jgi:hypothetical protein
MFETISEFSSDKGIFKLAEGVGSGFEVGVVLAGNGGTLEEGGGV